MGEPSEPQNREPSNPEPRNPEPPNLALHASFLRGDLEALRAAVGDPALVPNGPLPPGFGSCLVYAISHSPRPFIRELLALGADPNAPADDGFPPLLAALGSGREAPDVRTRADVDDVVRMLLDAAADPNQRGINDYTALHMAVAERQALAVQMLLDAGADPMVRTRIDDCETPLDMARAAGLADIAAILERRGQPARQRLRSGVTLLLDIAGRGAPVLRQHSYSVRLRMWLVQGGSPVVWTAAWGPVGHAWLEDDGRTLFTTIHVNRGSLLNGLFYGLDGMSVGGTRRLELAPHVACGDRGIPEVVPPRAGLTAEITVLAAADRRA